MSSEDLFFQWIGVPDDRPALPPVDEEFGLKDFSSLVPTDLNIDQLEGYNASSSGLLLGHPDICHNARQCGDTFDTITLSYGTQPDAEQNAVLLASEASMSSPSHVSYATPPALSPDSSPTSVASSTPWLRTPESDPSRANIANFTPVDSLWDIAEAEDESCSVHLVDMRGNCLEDVPSQDVMVEDIACTPQIIPDASLPQIPIANPSGSLGSVTQTPLSDTPMFMIYPHCPSASPPEATPLGPGSGTLFPPSSPQTSRSLFAFSPSLSPLSTLSFFSQSPGASPNPSPIVSCSSLSPALSPVPLSNGDEVTNSTSSTFTRVTSAKLRGKRSAGTLDNDAPPWKIPRRSKAKNADEEEWNPGSERVKRPRAIVSSQSIEQTATSIPNYPPDESSNCEISQGSEGQSDAAHTSCEICGQGFTRTSDYVRHIENSASHPETRKVWPCPYCESALGRRDALGRHIRTLHPERQLVIPQGIPGSQLPESQKEPVVQRIGQRKIPSSKRQAGKDTRRYH
ncbi:hypothetical protein J3R83DRAFT_2943 [Lanmaoa asiatica]|nr:hypothetical protein J3R83DRAFT_2943 [Lanmaoa asiatica]